MILRDMYCCQCYSVVRDVPLDSLCVRVASLLCDDCRDMTDHLPVCNGGLKTRFRQQDWPTDPKFYRGQVTCGPPTAEVAATGEPVMDLHTGKPMHEKERFVLEDRRAERRDRKYFETDKRRGTVPQFYDQGKR